MAFGTPVVRGTNTVKASGNTITVSPTSAMVVGVLAMVDVVVTNIAIVDGASSTISLSDTDGHTWVKVLEVTETLGVADDGLAHAFFITQVTSEIGTGDVITATLSSTPAGTAKLIGLLEVSVSAGYAVAGSVGTGATGTTGTATLSGLPSAEYLLVGVDAAEVEDAAATGDADYTDLYHINTTGGTAATNQSAKAQYRIATLTGDTFTITNFGGAASEHVTVLVAIAESGGAGTQNLTGSLFTKAPTFNTGAVTSVRNLTGVLFTKAPTFNTGTVTAGAVTLTGVLFTKAPTFPTGAVSLGAGPQTVSGVLFTKAPTFFTGTVTAGAVTLAGVLFTKAPTFPTGAISLGFGPQALNGILFTKAGTFPTGAITTGAVSLAGVLFTKAPIFPTGVVSSGASVLNGVLFQKAPTFPTGTITAGAINLAGVLFTKAPIFPAGTIGISGTIFGNLFVNSPAFFTGSMSQPGPTFWSKNPVAFVKVGPAGPSPWGTELSGAPFRKAPTFPVGAVT